MGTLSTALGKLQYLISLVRRFLIETTLFSLVVTFVLLLCVLFAPSLGRVFGFPTIFLLGGLFFVLGIFLVWTARKRKVEGRLLKFLLLSGLSASGFLSGVVLHNFFYALGVLFSEIMILRFLAEAIHILFFLGSVFVAPLGFLVGTAGSVFLLLKRRRP